MSLRTLARAYLDELASQSGQVTKNACPVSGRLGLSGPDKAAQSHISLRVEPVRTPDTIRTEFRPDSSDASDKPDGSNKSYRVAVAKVGSLRSTVFPVPRPRVTGPTDRFCDCGRMATLAYSRGDGREAWFCLECLDSDGRA